MLRAGRALMDAFEMRCLVLQYPAHGSRRRRRSRSGAVTGVHRTASALSSRQSTGIDTGAPGRARGENAQTEVFVRVFRR